MIETRGKICEFHIIFLANVSQHETNYIKLQVFLVQNKINLPSRQLESSSILTAPAPVLKNIDLCSPKKLVTLHTFCVIALLLYSWKMCETMALHYNTFKRTSMSESYVNQENDTAM